MQGELPLPPSALPPCRPRAPTHTQSRSNDFADCRVVVLRAGRFCYSALTWRRGPPPLGVFGSTSKMCGFVLRKRIAPKDVGNSSKQRATGGTALWHCVVFIFLHQLSANNLGNKTCQGWLKMWQLVRVSQGSRVLQIFLAPTGTDSPNSRYWSPVLPTVAAWASWGCWAPGRIRPKFSTSLWASYSLRPEPRPSLRCWVSCLPAELGSAWSFGRAADTCYIWYVCYAKWFFKK